MTNLFRMAGVLGIRGFGTLMGEEAVSTESQLTELWKAPYLRRFQYNVKPSAVSGLPGIRSATPIEKALNSCLAASPAIGTNKIYEVCENFIINVWPDFVGGGTQAFSLPWLYSMVMNAATPTGTCAGECLQGIQIGSFAQLTPWQTNFGLAQSPVFQLRYNFTRVKWELLVWDQDTLTAPDVVDCDIQPTFTADFWMSEVALLYVPAPAGGSYLDAYINGKLAYHYTGARLQACYGAGIGAGSGGAGYFLTNGSNNTNEMVEGTFYDNRIVTLFDWTDPN